MILVGMLSWVARYLNCLRGIRASNLDALVISCAVNLLRFLFR